MNASIIYLDRFFILFFTITFNTRAVIG